MAIPLELPWRQACRQTGPYAAVLGLSQVSQSGEVYAAPSLMSLGLCLLPPVTITCLDWCFIVFSSHGSVCFPSFAYSHLFWRSQWVGGPRGCGKTTWKNRKKSSPTGQTVPLPQPLRMSFHPQRWCSQASPCSAEWHMVVNHSVSGSPVPLGHFLCSYDFPAVKSWVWLIRARRKPDATAVASLPLTTTEVFDQDCSSSALAAAHLLNYKDTSWFPKQMLAFV